MAWSAPITNTGPSNNPPTTSLNNLLNIAQLGTNNRQNMANIAQLGTNRQTVPNLDQLLRGSSVVIPLENLQIQNAPAGKASAVNGSRTEAKGKMQSSEIRQNPALKVTRVPIRFPTSNTAIIIPTNLLSRIRRQTPRGFLVLMNPDNNQTLSDLQLTKMNNRSVLLLTRRLSPETQQNVSPVNLNNHPIKTQHSNQPKHPRVNIQRLPLRSVQNQNRQQLVQGRQQLPQRQQTASHPVVRPQQQSRQSNLIRRNRPLVQTISSSQFPRSHSLRTGQTGQLHRFRPRTAVVRAHTRRRRPPPDPFTSRFSAGFARGTNLLVQPPLENATFFNADGSRTILNGRNTAANTIQRGNRPTNFALPPPAMNFGNALLPDPMLGGFGGFPMFR